MLFLNTITLIVLMPLLINCGAIPTSAQIQTEQLEKLNSKDGLPLFLDLLRQHQRDADQTFQSFNDVLKRDADWILRDSDGKPITSETCNDAAKGVRRKFGIFINDHINDFEKCVDEFVTAYKNAIFTIDLDQISTEASKCISLTRMNVFWSEYRNLHDAAKENCQKTNEM